jgi:hypothetical protein
MRVEVSVDEVVDRLGVGIEEHEPLRATQGRAAVAREPGRRSFGGSDHRDRERCTGPVYVDRSGVVDDDDPVPRDQAKAGQPRPELAQRGRVASKRHDDVYRRSCHALFLVTSAAAKSRA